MKLILHIGMGKTGSSAIQKALSENSAELAHARAAYLGMWFDMVDQKYADLDNQMSFFSQSCEGMEGAARKLLDGFKEMHATTGVETFVISNEAMSGQSYALKPLIDVLIAANVEVQVIGFIRNPFEWLPSAYVQWGVRDKVEPGKVKPYASRARELVYWYSGMLDWLRLHRDIVSMAYYDDSEDVVGTFSALSKLPLTGLKERVLERAEDTEVLLRALFNNRFAGHVFPEEFDESVFSSIDKIASIEEAISQYLDYSDTAGIIDENSELFDAINEELGFDICRVRPGATPRSGGERIRRRIVDVLLALALRQCQEIKAMELRISTIEKVLARRVLVES